MKRFLLSLLLILPFSLHGRADEPSSFFFKDGDRILFLGDSITEQYQYSNTIELYLTTRFPRAHFSFLNAGIGGDTAGGGKNRFKEHILDEKPTALTINFGMNDGGYGGFNPNAAANFIKNTEEMLKAARDNGIRVALISPNAVDWRKQKDRKVYLETQKQFYAPLQQLAQKYGIRFADQYATTRKALEKMEMDEARTADPFPDSVHTSSMGGLFMAHAILTGLHAPAQVSAVEIDAPSGKVSSSQARVSNVRAATDKVTFERLDESVPMPIAREWGPILPYVNNLDDLNSYGLKVTGLVEGKYNLAIDGKNVATYSAEQLSKGVNLGLLTSGPIHEQGKKVFDAINSKGNITHDRFRNVLMFNAPAWLADVARERKGAELAKRSKQIDERQAEIDKLVQPVPHQFELQLIK